MRQLPPIAWFEIESAVTWATLGCLLKTSRERKQRVMLEALRRVVNGGLLPLSKVAIHGLQQRVELNGARGVCLEFDNHSGRWLVEFGDGEVKNVKPSNLRTIGRIDRPMTATGSSRGSRQISAALPCLIHVLNGAYSAQVRDLFNEQLQVLLLKGQGGVLLACARIAGVGGLVVDGAPAAIQEKARWELTNTLADTCEQSPAPCPAHIAALLHAGADVGTFADIGPLHGWRPWLRHYRNRRLPLEHLICNSEDFGRFLDPVKLFVERGASARRLYIMKAIVKFCEEYESWETALVSEWTLVWRSLIRNSAASGILSHYESDDTPHSPAGEQNLLKARDYLQGMAHSIEIEMREAHSIELLWELKAVTDMTSSLNAIHGHW